MSSEGLVQKANRFIDRNSPAILTGITITGVAGTAVLAVQGTPQALRDIADAESERLEPLTALEKVRLTWRNYIPAAAVGLLTIGTAIGAQSINNRRQSVLMGLAAMTETAFREYREKAAQIIGEKKEIEIKDAVAKEHLMSVPMMQSEVIITGQGDHLCFDGYSGRYFRGNVQSVQQAVNKINSQCLTDNYASQNEFYEMIGLPGIRSGEELGWRFDHLMDIHFGSHLDLDEKPEPALSIEYNRLPIPTYYKING